jgi:hypothetical protein
MLLNLLKQRKIKTLQRILKGIPIDGYHFQPLFVLWDTPQKKFQIRFRLFLNIFEIENNSIELCKKYLPMLDY